MAKKKKRKKKLQHMAEAITVGAIAGTIGSVLGGIILKLLGI